MRVCLFVCVFVCVHVCVRVYVSVCARVCVCVQATHNSHRLTADINTPLSKSYFIWMLKAVAYLPSVLRPTGMLHYQNTAVLLCALTLVL